MKEEKDSTPTREQLKESGIYLRKAYNLANFGTLTSLVSTGAYFVEQTFVEAKQLSPVVKKITIGAISIGVASVLASYYYSLKAGTMALRTEELLSDEHGRELNGPPSETQEKWVEKSARKTALSKVSPG